MRALRLLLFCCLLSCSSLLTFGQKVLTATAAPGVVRPIAASTGVQVSSPNDPRFAEQWALTTVGAPTAWTTTTGSQDVVVGIVDSGVEYTHPDLAANMWSAPAGWNVQGCAAGSHGYSAINGTTDCDPQDSYTGMTTTQVTGTAIAGVIGAVGNNGLGISGVSQHVSLMALRCVGADGVPHLADVQAVLEYALAAKAAGVNLRVLSFGFTGGSSFAALQPEIEALRDAGILVVAPAGDSTNNNDQTSRYPASFALPNVLTVLPTEPNDSKTSTGNYGQQAVHLGAPGGLNAAILTTVVGGGYDLRGGSAIAAAHVSGAAALLVAATPAATPTVAEVRSRLVDCGEQIESLSAYTSSGRRLNVANSLNNTGCSSTLTTSVMSGSNTGQITVSPQQPTYVSGTAVTVTAHPVAGYHLANWVVNGQARAATNPLVITVTGNTQVVANFVANTYTLVVRQADGLDTTIAPGPGPYPAGTVVTVTAQLHDGYQFAGWYRGTTLLTTALTVQVTMNADDELLPQVARSPANYSLFLSITSGGQVRASTQHGSAGPTLPAGTEVTLTVSPNSGMVFTGWLIDGLFQGWANPLTLTMYTPHTVVANFAPRHSFRDLPPGPPPYEAVSQLAARKIILGYTNGNFGTNDTTQRVHMAALIVRAMGWGDRAATNPFVDRGGLDDSMWRPVGILAAADIVRGYGDGRFGPTDPVLQVQTIAFISRAMVYAGYWTTQHDVSAAALLLPNTSAHWEDLATYLHYAGLPPGVAAGIPWEKATAPATRGWFAETLWQAFDSYHRVDRLP